MVIASRACDRHASWRKKFLEDRRDSQRPATDTLQFETKLIAKDSATAQARRNYRNTKLFPPFSPALLVLKIRHLISNHSAHILLASTGLCRDSICDFCGITSTVGRTRLGAAASSWDQL